MNQVRVLQVIETNILRRGDGTKGNPFRVVTQYWTMDGEIITEIDPEDEFTDEERMIIGKRRADGRKE